MPDQLGTYEAQVSVIGQPADVFRAAVEPLKEELGFRPHLLEPEVAWDAARNAIKVHVKTQAPDAAAAAAMVRDEISEVVPAVVDRFERYRVEVG